jgi:hypothetical protein
MHEPPTIKLPMKQPTDQHERNEDKKHPEENPSRGIDPETEKQEEMEVVDQDPGHRQKENQNQKKDDDLAA